MEPSRLSGLYRTGVSVFVAAALAAQAATIPVTAMHGSFLRSKLFPILEYPMYAPAHYEGERVTASFLLEGVLQDGKIIPITREQLGVDIFDYVDIVQTAMRPEPAAAQTLLDVIHQHIPGADQFQEVRIKSYPMQVTRDGPKPLPSQVMKTIPLEPKLSGSP